MIVHQRLRRLWPVSKLSTSNENIPNAKAPPSSKEAIFEAAKPNLQSSIKELMDENKVLELNTNYVTDDVIDKVHLGPNTNNMSTISKTVLVEANESIKGSLLEQFRKSRDASMSKHNDFLDSDDSKVQDVGMPFGIPGGGIQDNLEDDLTEQEQAFCDRYDIRLNSRCRK
ncbi:hypothetical protein Tco_0439599 [Tanacetum coccineum]